MKPQLLFLLFPFLIITFAGFSSPRITAIHYNKKKNTTVFNLVRYSKIWLPGKWDYMRFDKRRREHVFSNRERTVVLCIAINPAKSYTFYKDGITENEFVDSFFLRDLQDTAIGNNDRNTIIQKDTINHYILGSFHARRDVIYALYGFDNGKAYSYLISSPQWDAAREIDFLLKGIKRKDE